MGKLETILEELASESDCKRAQPHFDAASAKIRQVMLETLLLAIGEADTLDQLGELYIARVNEL